MPAAPRTMQISQAAEHTAQQVEHHERTTECQYLARLMRALSNKNSNSSSMVPCLKHAPAEPAPKLGLPETEIGSRQAGRPTVRLTPRRASGGSPKFHGPVRVRRSVSFRDSRGVPAESGPLTKLIVPPAAARRFAEFRCNIVTSWITVVFLVFSNTFEGARSIRPGFCQRRAAAWQWQITRTVVIPSTIACVFAQ